jgi:hypothetical protein
MARVKGGSRGVWGSPFELEQSCVCGSLQPGETAGLGDFFFDLEEGAPEGYHRFVLLGVDPGGERSSVLGEDREEELDGHREGLAGWVVWVVCGDLEEASGGGFGLGFLGDLEDGF